MRRKRIVFTAQPRGFGPVSKACNLSMLFKNAHKIFLGSSISFQFATESDHVFDQIIDIDTISETKIKERLEAADFVVNVMNQDIAFYCYELGLPYFFFDSLFGFWETTSAPVLFGKFSALQQERRLTRKDYESWTSHEKKLLSHFLAYASFIQNFIGVRERLEQVRDHLPRSVLVSPFVTQYVRRSDNNREPQSTLMLINIGGVKGRCAAREEFSYVSFVEELASRLIFEHQLGIDKIVICSGLRSRHRTLHFGGNRTIEHGFYGNADFLRQMRNAKITLSSPGLTTILESVFMAKPVVFLPEQHGSQIYNMSKIRETQLGDFTVAISDIADIDIGNDPNNFDAEAFFDNLSPSAFEKAFELVLKRIRLLDEYGSHHFFSELASGLEHETIPMDVIEATMGAYTR